MSAIIILRKCLNIQDCMTRIVQNFPLESESMFFPYRSNIIKIIASSLTSLILTATTHFIIIQCSVPGCSPSSLACSMPFKTRHEIRKNISNYLVNPHITCIQNGGYTVLGPYIPTFCQYTLQHEHIHHIFLTFRQNAL